MLGHRAGSGDGHNNIEKLKSCVGDRALDVNGGKLTEQPGHPLQTRAAKRRHTRRAAKMALCAGALLAAIPRLRIARFVSNPVAGNAANDPLSLPAFHAVARYLMK